MHVEIKGVHVEITQEMQEHVDKRLPHLDYAKDMIIDLLVTITKDNGYKVEANINFRWGHSIHVGEEGFDILEGIDKLFDKMELKISKEKKRVQDHKGPGHDREP